ncbi:mitochondrial 54S ribosomal protein bL32m [Kockiozyma suomiensis]|uniref:mitochondrial 54S ribosomal protein bL32m n=1 Tax=Kockiozyma suomiensis TaxID=1337062 RepID=UPI003342F3FB
MASRHLLTSSWAIRLSAVILPRLSLPIPALAAPLTPRITIRFPLPTLPSPSDFGISNPFGGIVLAVPKKKTSLRRRRMRRLIPDKKKVKPVTSLNECPSCGRVKRMHTVCGPCHDDVRDVWRAESGKLAKDSDKETKPVSESIDVDYLEIINEKLTSIPKSGKFLSDLSREEHNKKKIPMFDYDKLTEKRKGKN